MFPPEIVAHIMFYIDDELDARDWWYAWYKDRQDTTYYKLLETMRNGHVKSYGDLVKERGLTSFLNDRIWPRKPYGYCDFDNETLLVITNVTMQEVARVRKHMEYLELVLLIADDIRNDLPLLTRLELRSRIIHTYNLTKRIQSQIPKLRRLHTTR